MKQLACFLVTLCLVLGILLIAVADVNHGHGPGHAAESSAHGEVVDDHGEPVDEHGTSVDDHGEEVDEDHASTADDGH